MEITYYTIYGQTCNLVEHVFKFGPDFLEIFGRSPNGKFKQKAYNVVFLLHLLLLLSYCLGAFLRIYLCTLTQFDFCGLLR